MYTKLWLIVVYMIYSTLSALSSSQNEARQSSHRGSRQIRSLPYLDDFSPYFPDLYYHPYENGWITYDDRSNTEIQEPFTSPYWQDHSYLYGSDQASNGAWLEQISYEESNALIERMAMLWKTQLTDEGRNEVQHRIQEQITLMEADVLMSQSLTSRAVKDIIRRTEAAYLDHELQDVVSEVVMKTGVSETEVTKYVHKVLRHDGLRGQDIASIADHVIWRMQHPRVHLPPKDFAELKMKRREQSRRFKGKLSSSGDESPPRRQANTSEQGEQQYEVDESQLNDDDIAKLEAFVSIQEQEHLKETKSGRFKLWQMAKKEEKERGARKIADWRATHRQD